MTKKTLNKSLSATQINERAIKLLEEFVQLEACYFGMRRRENETCAEYRESMSASDVPITMGCTWCEADKLLKELNIKHR